MILGITASQRNKFTGLLDDYPNAAAAYSLRKLRAAYTGSAIRVRRSNDNAEQDIGFDGSGNLDTSSLSTFVGANNGFVTNWYDQSGNSNDATQSTAANQPKIYDSSTGVVLENSKPALSFASSYFTIPNSKTTFKFMHNGTSNTIFTVAKAGIIDNPNAAYGILGTGAGGGNNNGISLFYDDRSQFGRNNMIASLVRSPQSVLNLVNNIFTANTTNLLYLFTDSDNATASARSRFGVNGAADQGNNTLTGISADIDSTYDMQIGALGNNVLPITGLMQSVIIYPSDQSANRTGIETNINDYYAIY